ncbi:MAG: site-2 protease family protein [Desulfobulbaceae bacterium]|nr:site-2 protease family protein [Desulfobulbaceae bacterium]MCK5543751.1 site-2 protease family protein [Desulfobulbaceae bacterium]
MNLQQIAIYAPSFLFALTIHEYSHGYVANRLGDPTASLMGRLTLNPLKHLDPMGVICFFIMKIGWAKPIPVNPRYFKNPKQDMLWVALAGPGANFLLALASGMALKSILVLHALIPAYVSVPLEMVFDASIWVNVMLAVFNLIPIPPLDGSRVLQGILPPKLAASYARFESYGLIILLFLFYFTGVFQKVFLPVIYLGYMSVKVLFGT